MSAETASNPPRRSSVALWLSSLVRIRPMYSKEEMLDTPLDRCLTVYHLIFYSVANMAGAGIYVLTGRLIRDEAGAAACLSYLLAAASSAFTGLCYAEFATLVPKAGSVYIYTFLTLGELPAFVIGWTSVSDILVGIASISKAFSGTIDELSHTAISNWTDIYVGRLATSENSMLSPSYDFVALGLIILMMLITATGAKFSMTFNMVITIIQVICLIIMSVGCFVYGSAESFSPKHGGFAPHGLQGIINGSTIAVFAFSGFDSIANASEETIEPKKNIPRALYISLIIVSGLYFMASFGLAYLVPREMIDYTSPFVRGFSHRHVVWLVWISAIGTLMATGAGKVTNMYVVPRIFYSLAGDGLISHCFGTVNQRTLVPLAGLLFGGTLSAVLAFILNIQTLAEFVSLGILFSYFAIGVDILFLRYLMVLTPVSSADPTQEKIDPQVTAVDPPPLVIRKTFRNVEKCFPSVTNRWTFLCSMGSVCFLSVLIGKMSQLISTSSSYFSWIIVGTVLLLLLVSCFLLTMYQPSHSTETYQTPFMPMAPVMTIFINAILIARLPSITWLRFSIWMGIGLLIYFAYGRSHSVANTSNEYLRLEEPVVKDKEDKETYGT